MNHFVNEYQQTVNISDESVKTWWKWKFKKAVYGILIAMLLFLIITFLTKDYGYLKLEIAFLVLFVILKIKIRIAMKTERERMQVMYPDELPIVRLEIGENIKLKTKNNCKNVSFSDVEAIAESKNLIVLCVKGLMTISLTKDGFIEGTADECLSYLHKKISKK